jgi:response regulator RpfG family c-di-GMP phosphodiesterase
MVIPSAPAPSLAEGASQSSRHSILVVDDEETIRQVLVRWLESSGYAAASARSADEALARLETNPVGIVLCDIRMPGHDGLWLAARIRQRYPETAIIMSSGVHDMDAASECARQGVVDYLLKPFGRDRLRDAVGRAVDWHTAAWDARRWREALHREMDTLKASLWDRVHRQSIDNDDDLEAVLSSLPVRVPEMSEHTRRVAVLALAIARVLGRPDADLDHLRRAALLHELGKLALPDAVLRKPAPLTADEQALVRLLPHLTARMLTAAPFLAPAGAIVRDVAERMDAQGYPRALRGAAVALESRILAVADAYDTMTHPRVYRDAIPAQEAMLELARCAGTQFDPAVVNALDTAVDEISRLD